VPSTVSRSSGAPDLPGASSNGRTSRAPARSSARLSTGRSGGRAAEDPVAGAVISDKSSTFRSIGVGRPDPPIAADGASLRAELAARLQR